MDFDLNEEQRMLKDSVDRLVADKYAFESRNKYAAEENGFSREMWAQFAELGLLALPFSEEDGGFGGGAVETMIVMEALGRALALEPYIATIVLSGGLLRRAGSAEQRAAYVPQIVSGEKLFAFAHSERKSRYTLSHVETKARKEGGQYVIDGEKSLVLNGDSADFFIVSARTAGDKSDTDGIGLFIVDAKAPGVTRRGYTTQDGGRAAEVSFKNVQVSAEAALGDPSKAFPVIEQVVAEAIAATCSEAVGGMEEMQNLTVEYLKTRKQFGLTIGSFQALQHRAVDIFVAVEQARSITMYATVMAGESDPIERARAMSAAKVQVGRSIKFVGQQSVQLHGGVGVTFEYKVGHYFKRTTMIDTLFGDADYHLAKLADLGGLAAA